MANQTEVQRPRKGKDAPRPDWVQIGGRVWEITWYIKPEDFKKRMADIGFNEVLGDDDVAACTDHHHLEIHMRTDMVLTLQRENLLHEIMHAALFGVRPDHGSNMEAKDMDWEEFFISMLDSPLLMTLKYNPHVLAWLMAG